jgi:hypothetical protein
MEKLKQSKSADLKARLKKTILSKTYSLLKHNLGLKLSITTNIMKPNNSVDYDT